jgi:hypothetical protein
VGTGKQSFLYVPRISFNDSGYNGEFCVEIESKNIRKYSKKPHLYSN